MELWMDCYLLSLMRKHAERQRERHNQQPHEQLEFDF